MPLQICILGSGSSGNCTYVASDTTSILLDAGFSAKETSRRLSQIGVEIDRVQGICVSHEHNDHTIGLRVLHRRHQIPLYANRGTIEALTQDSKHRDLVWQVFTSGSPFVIGDLHIESFSVPHDAYEPVGFIVRTGEARVGVVLDMGMATHLIRERLRPCHALVIEANYDELLLQHAPRPWYLKQRIRGRQGHMSNQHAAEMVADIAGPHLRQVFLAHLSEECNRHDLALETTQKWLNDSGSSHVKVSLTFPDRISELWNYPR